LVLSWAFWNGHDPILKERLFGLTSYQGNHGEDVKEEYFYADGVPSHAYMKYVYKYPQRPFPYAQLIKENGRRSAAEREYELVDTGIFNEGRYFDIVIEYAKASAEETVVKVEAWNRGPDPAPLWIVPQLYFRNRWAWEEERKQEPIIEPGADGKTGEEVCVVADDTAAAPLTNLLFEYRLGKRYLYGSGGGEVLFTNNEDAYTGKAPYKDAFHKAIAQGEKCGAKKGTKSCFVYRFSPIEPGQSKVVYLRLTPEAMKRPLADVERVIARRKKEADAFYAAIHPPRATEEEKQIQRAALAGMVWNKQIYLFDVDAWLQGDRLSTPPPASRLRLRNVHWRHLNSMRILSMPDKWEYPWFASWDLAFHAVTWGLIDLEFAKEQIWLLLFDQFQHPNGQIPAYEWEFSEKNPPVQAWGAWKLFEMEREREGKGDFDFLRRCFDKLLINFAWWVNRVDSAGYNVFEGGFLGLDNIGLLDRSDIVGSGAKLEQSDGTGWMAFFCLQMMRIALTLAERDPSYEGLATKFFQHFVYIARAIKTRDDVGCPLWNEEDGFFYDTLIQADGSFTQFKVRSLVGLIPLNAVEWVTAEELERHPEFRKNFLWFIRNRPQLVADCVFPHEGGNYLLSIVSEEHLARVLRYVWDPEEFRAEYGLRSLSKVHAKHPVVFKDKSITYEPAESVQKIKGGNSNWRGPVWFPTTYFLIASLEKFGQGLNLKTRVNGEKPATLQEMARSFAERLIKLYANGSGEAPPALGRFPLAKDPGWKGLVRFYEYFHPETGEGLGASHQTGWTGLIANLIDNYRR
jgi:hypothetical protein